MPLIPRQTVIGGSAPGLPPGGGSLPAGVTNPELTAYTGGAANALDSLPTAARPAGSIVTFISSANGFRVFQLQAGTGATAVPGIVRPVDFNSSTNPKIWVSQN